jgi:hypothetical protein
MHRIDNLGNFVEIPLVFAFRYFDSFGIFGNISVDHQNDPEIRITVRDSAVSLGSNRYLVSIQE